MSSPLGGDDILPAETIPSTRPESDAIPRTIHTGGTIGDTRRGSRRGSRRVSRSGSRSGSRSVSRSGSRSVSRSGSRCDSRDIPEAAQFSGNFSGMMPRGVSPGPRIPPPPPRRFSSGYSRSGSYPPPPRVMRRSNSVNLSRDPIPNSAPAPTLESLSEPMIVGPVVVEPIVLDENAYDQTMAGETILDAEVVATPVSMTEVVDPVYSAQHPPPQLNEAETGQMNGQINEHTNPPIGQNGPLQEIPEPDLAHLRPQLEPLHPPMPELANPLADPVTSPLGQESKKPAPFWTQNKKIGAGVLVLVLLGAIGAALGIALSESDGTDTSPSVQQSPNVPAAPAPATPPPTTSPTASPIALLCAPFELKLETDIYANETLWEVTKNTETTVFSGGPYPFGIQSIVETTCLPMGGYEFKIKDINADGICCNHGIGKYGVTLGNKVLRLFSNGIFDAEETLFFNVTKEDFSNETIDFNGPIDYSRAPSTAPSFGLTSISTKIPDCSNVRILTDPTNATWELLYKDAGLSFQESGNQTLCLRDGTYQFRFADGGEGGYFIYVDDVLMGVSFLYQETLTFVLPYEGQSVCNTDFVLVMNTEDSPEDISWMLKDGNGEVVLEGGPYEESFASISSTACLSDGEYMLVVNGDGASFSLFIESIPVLNPGSNTSFIIGPKAPTSSPTKPSDCSVVNVVVTTDEFTGGDGDIMTWELRNDNEEVVLNGGPLGSSITDNQEVCLPAGMYTFDITDSGRDGFHKDCELCGYFILADDVFVGGSVLLNYNDKMTFSVPYLGDEPDEDDNDFCSGDFALYLRTDAWPDETYWELKDDLGKVILSGGPYKEKMSAHSHRACLPDGTFEFTIYDSGGDGLSTPGYYALYSETTTLVDGGLTSGNFGASHTTVFALGKGVSVPPSSNPPEEAPACHDVRIVVVTDTSTGNDVTQWQLTEEANDVIVASGGPLGSNETSVHDQCLPAGMYTFNISDSGGNGFDCDGCGYFVFSSDVFVGGSVSFFHNELFSFTIPFYGDEPDKDEHEWCSDDFYVAIATVEGSSWELVGPMALSGGPYQSQGVVSHRACLPDGAYEFTINHDGAYYLEVEGEDLSDDIGAIAFTLGSTAVAECTNVTIVMKTDVDTGTNHVVFWELRHMSEIVLGGGPLQSSARYEEVKCLPNGTYSFHISDSGGDGFGNDCDDCGYFIYSGDAFVGGSILFYHEEVMTFSIPFYQDEPDEDDFSWCSSDFLALVYTDDRPDETTWELADKSNNILLKGGPYQDTYAAYSHRACLPDGTFRFTIYDSGGDGIAKPGFYFLIAESKVLVDGGSFGYSNSTTFSLGPTSAPISSSALSSCVDLVISIQSDDNTGDGGDVTTWELIREGTVVASGGPLGRSEIYLFEDCLDEGVYTFNITDSGGDGFDCEDCGYFIYANDNYIGGSPAFFHNELATFQIPHSGDGSEGDEPGPCLGDFYLAIVTDWWADEITWDLVDAYGNVGLVGGPYAERYAIYTQRACLPDGTFNFTIYDSGADGISLPGFYLLYAEEEGLVTDGDTSGQFLTSNTTTFTLGTTKVP